MKEKETGKIAKYLRATSCDYFTGLYFTEVFMRETTNLGLPLKDPRNDKQN